MPGRAGDRPRSKVDRPRSVWMTQCTASSGRLWGRFRSRCWPPRSLDFTSTLIQDMARPLGPAQALLRYHFLIFFNNPNCARDLRTMEPKTNSFDSGLAASISGYERARHIVKDQGGTTVALRIRARRARCSGVARTPGHDTHRDLTDAMGPETFLRSAYPHRLGSALGRTGSRDVELTHELLCLRGSFLNDGRNRPGQIVSRTRLDTGCRGSAWDEPDGADDPGGANEKRLLCAHACSTSARAGYGRVTEAATRKAPSPPSASFSIYFSGALTRSVID